MFDSDNDTHTHRTGHINSKGLRLHDRTFITHSVLFGRESRWMISVCGIHTLSFPSTHKFVILSTRATLIPIVCSTTPNARVNLLNNMRIAFGNGYVRIDVCESNPFALMLWSSWHKCVCDDERPSDHMPITVGRNESDSKSGRLLAATFAVCQTTK